MTHLLSFFRHKPEEGESVDAMTDMLWFNDMRTTQKSPRGKSRAFDARIVGIVPRYNLGLTDDADYLRKEISQGAPNLVLRPACQKSIDKLVQYGLVGIPAYIRRSVPWLERTYVHPVVVITTTGLSEVAMRKRLINVEHKAKPLKVIEDHLMHT
jgi:hypothetical protein